MNIVRSSGAAVMDPAAELLKSLASLTELARQRADAAPDAATIARRLDEAGFHPPHPAQAMIDASPARYRVLDCGRRLGKTEYLMRWLAAGAMGGGTGGYFTPTYPMLTDVWRVLSRRCEALGARTIASEHRVEFPGGGSIDCWSAGDEANRCRGRAYDRVALDEWALVPGAEAAWEESIRPTLTDRRGQATFASTPRRGGHFEALYRRGQDVTWQEWASWQLPTSANPFIAPAEIEAARTTVSAQRFAQEYLAEFEAADSDLVYPEFREELHMRPVLVPWEATRWRLAGIDPGGGDPTAIVPIGVDPKQERIQVYGVFRRAGGVDLDTVINWLSGWQKRAAFHAILVDPSAKGWVEELRRVGLPAMPAMNKRDEGFEVVRWVLESGRFGVDPVCREIAEEFSSYRWALRRDGETGERYATRTPADHHGDSLDALRYGLVYLVRQLMAAPRVVSRPVGAKTGAAVRV